MRLSARGYHRVLRVARTLADLDGAEKVARVHLAEALSYRALVDEVRRRREQARRYLGAAARNIEQSLTAIPQFARLCVSKASTLLAVRARCERHG
jgi:Magnesium chelatase, subunit ChlI C-terminal